MKTLLSKLKSIALLLLLAIAFTSCGDDKKEDTTNPDSESKQEQVNTPVTNNNDGATSFKSQQDSQVQIAQEEDGSTSPDFSEAAAAAIILECTYFRKNPNAVLKDNPEAPVDYIITCMTNVDGKLTVEPGVTIAFEQNAGMNFGHKSSFKMKGNAEKPIVLTGKEQIKGFWRGIGTGSTSMSNTMSYVTIDYAGGPKAALEIYNEASNLSIEHCTFSNSKNYGMLTNRKVGKDVHNIVMNNCTFIQNKIPFKTDVIRLRLFNGTNKFSGNEKDHIELDGGTIAGDVTWAKLDVPYFLQGDLSIRDGVFSVSPGGTVVIMSSQKSIHVYQNASLVMVGTKDDPISIRGEHDVAGFWQQIGFKSSSPLNEIGYVNINNAGRTTKKPNGAVFLERGSFLNIHDVVYTDCFEYGVSVQDAARSHLEHANLSLDNTSKLFSDWRGKEIPASKNL